MEEVWGYWENKLAIDSRRVEKFNEAVRIRQWPLRRQENMCVGDKGGRKVNTVLSVMILQEDPGRFGTWIFPVWIIVGLGRSGHKDNGYCCCTSTNEEAAVWRECLLFTSGLSGKESSTAVIHDGLFVLIKQTTIFQKLLLFFVAFPAHPLHIPVPKTTIRTFQGSPFLTIGGILAHFLWVPQENMFNVNILKSKYCNIPPRAHLNVCTLPYTKISPGQPFFERQTLLIVTSHMVEDNALVLVALGVFFPNPWDH